MENIEHEFLQFVAEAIQEKYEVSSEQANKLVENSKISEMIYTAPDFVMHYDVEDWADEIMNDLFDDILGI